MRRMAKKTDTKDKEKDRSLMTLRNNLNSRCEPIHLVSFFFSFFWLNFLSVVVISSLTSRKLKQIEL